MMLLVAVAITLGSCKKTIDNIPGGKATATIDGKSYTAHIVNSMHRNDFFNIDATAYDHREVFISVPHLIDGVNTYAVDSMVNPGLYYRDVDGPPVRAASGQITVYFTDNNRAHGTFHMVCSDGTQIENGSFDVRMVNN